MCGGEGEVVTVTLCATLRFVTLCGSSSATETEVDPCTITTIHQCTNQWPPLKSTLDAEIYHLPTDCLIAFEAAQTVTILLLKSNTP